MQKTNFDYEIVIGEDCSTDNTRKILLEYKKKYPEKFKLLLHDKNIGITQNMVETYKSCEGKYVAMLEGDDYWIDKNKLQAQIDFLDNNQAYILCYTKVNWVNSEGNFLKQSNPEDKKTGTIEEILSRGWYMHTGTLLFRNKLITEFPDFFFKYQSTDYMLHILLAQHGKIGFIDKVTSAYRLHSGGITNDFKKDIIPFLNKKLNLLNEIDVYLKYKYTQNINVLRKDINSQLFIEKLKTFKIKFIYSAFFNLLRGNKKTIFMKFINFFKSKKEPVK